MINNNDIYLIDMLDITNRMSEFDVNLSEKKVSSAVLLVQDKNLRDLLGDELYFNYLTEYDSGTLSVANSALRPYIEQYLIAKVCERVVILIHDQITNKGYVNQNSDFSVVANKSDVFRAQYLYKDDAEFYQNRLFNFLIENIATYPLYTVKSYDISANDEPDEEFGMFMI